MMTIECIGPAFIYRWPGGEVHLEPGKLIDLPDERAQRLLSKAAGKVRLVTPTIAVGSQITWQRAGKAQQGVVDYLHTDADGTMWAFATTGETWAAVNMKYVTQRSDA